MEKNQNLSTIALALFSHGLTLYFSLSGIAGVHTAILTAAYQVVLLVIASSIILSTKAARQKLFSLQWTDALYITFIVLYLYDLMFPSAKVYIQENVLIYFIVCWTAFVLLRSLTFEQFKVFCRASTIITAMTCFICLAQVATGTALWVESGSRLTAGTSGNPITLGYTGAYAFLGSCIFLIADKPPLKWAWVFSGAAGFFICLLSGTRSATVSLFAGGALLTAYLLGIIFTSNKTTARFAATTFMVVGTLLFMIAVVDPLFASSSSVQKKEPTPIERSITGATNRISVLFSVIQGSGGDRSIRGRSSMYAYSWGMFERSPILGNGLYSAGNGHNAFLQVAAEFGMMGVLSFILPFAYLSYKVLQIAVNNILKLDVTKRLKHPAHFIKSDYSVITCFAFVILVQTLCLFSFHGTPYTNTIPVCSLGIITAFASLKNPAKSKLN